jgi:hypothetical protein
MNAPVIMSPATGRVIASCFALAAFAIALFAGLFGGNDAAQILLRAVTAMIVCYPVGVIVGMICDGVIHSHVAAKSTNAADDRVVPVAAGDAGTGMEQQAARTESVAAKSRAAA